MLFPLQSGISDKRKTRLPFISFRVVGLNLPLKVFPEIVLEVRILLVPCEYKCIVRISPISFEPCKVFRLVSRLGVRLRFVTPEFPVLLLSGEHWRISDVPYSSFVFSEQIQAAVQIDLFPYL